MKGIYRTIIIAALAIACNPYDGPESGTGTGQGDESAVLQEQIRKTNANADALQTIVSAYVKGENVIEVKEVNDAKNGYLTGYTISFSAAGSKTIYLGDDAGSLSLGVGQHPELGKYCWKIDGQWLLSGADPVVVEECIPKIRVNDGVWQVCCSGSTWEDLSVNGTNVSVACSFDSVKIDKSASQIVFTLSSGDSLTLKYGEKFGIKLSPEVQQVDKDAYIEVPYTITGGEGQIDVTIKTADNSYSAEVIKTDNKNGVIKVTALEIDESGTIIVAASNSKGEVVTAALMLSSRILNVADLANTVIPSIGGEIIVDVVKNIDYTVEVEQEWLRHTHTATTRALVSEVLTFVADANPTDNIRTAKVNLLDSGKNIVQTFNISQDKSGDIVLNWVYADQTLMKSFGYSEPAIDSDGNVYVVSNNQLVKIDPSGNKAWNMTLGWSGSDITPSVEPDGSVVYTAGGSGGSVRVYAVNADGSLKWDIGNEAFFSQNSWSDLVFWKSGVAIGDNHLIVSATRGRSVNAFSKENGTRTSYLSATSVGDKMSYGFTCSPALTKDGVVAARAAQGIVGANRRIFEYPSEDFKTKDQDYYVPVGIMTNYRNWQYCDRGPVIAVTYGGVNYLVSGGSESKNIHFNVWCQKSSKGLDITPPVLNTQSTNLDFWCKISGMKQTNSSGGGGIVAGARNELIISAEPADSPGAYSSGGFVAVWPAKNNMEDAFAYIFKHNAIVPGSCAVDNNGYVHVVDINGKYFILKPDYDLKTTSVILSFDIIDLVKTKVLEGISDATSMKVKSSVKIGTDGKIYINATFSKNGSNIGGTVCFSYKETTGVCPTSSWPQAGSDPMNTNRQVGYTALTNN